MGSQFVLAKDALSKINLGQSFAENDRVLLNQGVFVTTPALQAAIDPQRSKCIFVGRRGTGKTAISTQLKHLKKNVVQVHPELFSLLDRFVKPEELSDPRHKPFQSLTASFSRSLLAEAVLAWGRIGLVSLTSLPKELRAERSTILDFDFDLRCVDAIERMFTALDNHNDKEWLKLKKKVKAT